MARKPQAYVDTSALIALADRSDSFHSLFVRLFAEPPRLITTGLVIAEGHAWFLRRYDRYKAMQFMAMIEGMAPLAVDAIGRTEIGAAAAWMRKFKDQDLTLADAAGLHCMAQHKLRQCWSTDFHLALGGVPLVINS